MAAISIIHAEDPEKSPKQKKGQKHRRATDKYWMGLFVVLFIIWIIFLVEAIQRWINSLNFKKWTPEEFWEIFVVPDTLPSDYIFWGKNWIFDMITCNVAYLDAHYQTSGSIVIWANASFFIGLLVYAIRLIMNSDEAFNWQFAIAGGLFFASTLPFRFTVCSYIVCSYIYFHFNYTKLLFFIPEAMLFIIFCKKRRGKVRIPEGFLSGYLLSGVKCNVCYIALINILHLILLLMFIFSCCSPLFYANIGIIFYFTLAIRYLVHMADLSLTGVSFNTVAKYHFGTACYHATLIFPKLKTLLVINEPEFKGNPNTTITDRLSLLSGKINRMSLLATAATGMNHSEFIRGLLRLPSGYLPTLQPYRYFISINTAFLAFLLSTNSLMLMSFWALGYFDPSVSMKSYAYNLINFIVHYVVMTDLDSSVNVALLFGMYDELLFFEKWEPRNLRL